ADVWESGFGHKMPGHLELDRRQIDRIAQVIPGGSANMEDVYPLTPLQEGLLFHHLLSGGTETYALSVLLELDSENLVDALIRVLQAIIDKHDILRAAVLWEGLPRAVHVVCHSAPLPVVWLSPESGADPVERLKELADPRHQKWDLRQAPLMRVHVVRDAASSKFFVLLQLHHVICDYGSLRLVLDEAIDGLCGRSSNAPPPAAYRNHVFRVLEAGRTVDSESFFLRK